VSAEPTTLQLSAWRNTHAVTMLCALAAAVTFGQGALLSIAGVVGVMRMVTLHRASLAAAGGFGSANAVTSLRLFGSALLCGSSGVLEPHACSLLAAAVLALDGVDGWLARATHRASAFGAAYDMETDAFYVAASGFAAYRFGHVGLFFLTCGALRYLYVLTLAALGERDDDAPRTQLGRSVFGIVAASSIVALWPVPGLAVPFAICATLALAYSFGRSLAWVLRTRAERTAQASR
jgi:phosphatidylglycerophosphate synthase